MGTIRTLISQSISVAVVVAIILSCMPFVSYGVNGMMDVYSGMADAVMSGNGGEYADGILTQMDTGSQNVLGELGSWANGVIDEAGANDLVAEIMAFIKSLQ